MQLNNIIYKMLIENTGIHPLDSGRDNGRQWQRNANKTIKDFENAPEATLNIDDDWLDITLSTYHHLNKTLETDSYCDAFNKLKCNEWNGDYYGTSASQCDWLENHGFTESKRGAFNTYNWDSNLSQVLQGTFLTLDGIDEYVLLQVHGGADVRGGYTDAKLFKTTDYFLMEYASFTLNDEHYLDINGSDISIYNHETGDSNYINGNDLSDIKALVKDKTEFTGCLIGG
jgi:hypothetical protein